MKWLKDKDEFDAAIGESMKSRSIDNGQESTQLKRMLFDSTDLKTNVFLHVLRRLMEWSGDKEFRFMVLDPEPERYFFSHFGKYPLVEIATDDTDENYFAALNEDPGGSPADAIGTNWSEYVVLPQSRRWFVRGLRVQPEEDSGHLWVPHEWVSKIIHLYPSMREE